MLRYRATSGLEVTVDHVHGAEASYEPSSLEVESGLRVRWSDDQQDPAVVGVHSRVAGLRAETDGAGRLLVPTAARRLAEAAIEEFADLLAVAHQCRRTIRSPQTCVAMAAESSGEFNAATALSTGQSARPASARILLERCADQLPSFIGDRPEGLRLLASGLSEESPAGRAREYYRLIEAGFGLGIGALKKPLYEFLKTSTYSMDYGKKETDAWIALRGKVMHGDTYVASSADVVPFLPRLEWAAYDLLLHKRIWGANDVARRPGPPVMSGPSNQGTVTLFYPSASLGIEPMDPFGVYATDRRAEVTVAGDGILVNWPTPDSTVSDVQIGPTQSRSADRI